MDVVEIRNNVRSRIKSGAGQGGFIALMSAIVMSAILLILVTTVSTSSFYARADSLGSENKRISLGLAESCINVALLALATSTAPSTYSPVNLPVMVGVDAQGNTMTCTIQSVGHAGTLATIDTQASYKGSFTNVTARATVPDPTIPAIAPPTCAMNATPSPVPVGETVTFQWATAGTVTSFTISNGIGSVTPPDAGSYVYTTVSPGNFTYTGTVTGPGGSTQCTASFTVNSLPPGPSCADTVMMLDKTGSMTPTDLNNEEAAAHQLIDLYAGVSSFPKIGAGSFPGLDGNPASVPVSPYGQLPMTTPAVAGDYPILKNTVTQITNTASGFTDLSAAITKGYQELNSVRHTPGFRKVLILVSDGETNRPFMDGTNSVANNDAALDAADTAKINNVDIFTVRYSQNTNAVATLLLAQIASGTTPYVGPSGPHLPGADDNSQSVTSTAFLNPTATHSPNNWTNPNNAFSNDTTYTTNSVNAQAQGYSTFNFGIPAGAPINGIEVTLAGMVSAPTINTGNLVPSNVGNFNAWTQFGGTSKQDAVSTSNGDTSYVFTATQNNAQTFIVPNAGVPVGATINSVTVVAVARLTGAGTPTFKIRAEKGAGAGNQDDGSSTYTPTGSYATYTRQMNTNPFNGAAWTLAEVNAWTTRFGVIKSNSSGTVRVTQLYVVVNYTTGAASGSCDVGVDLSWNNGTSWSSAKPITLETGEASYIVGNSSDKWGAHAWASGEFSSGNFVLRLTNTSCSGTKAASVNYVSAKVHYSGYNPTLENTDGDNYFITPSTDLASITNIFETIGRKVCPAAAPQCSNGTDDDGDSLIDAADPMCHTGGILANPYDGTIADEYEHPAPGPGPTAPSPTPPIGLGSWEEIPQ